MADFSMKDLAPYAEGLFLSEAMQDYVQTSRFLKNPNNHELNPLLGTHPSRDRMNAGWGYSNALQYAAYSLLPNDLKLPYAALSAGLEGANILRNKKQFGYSWDKPALGLGALATAALASDWHKGHKNISAGIEHIPDTHAYGPVLRMEW